MRSIPSDFCCVDSSPMLFSKSSAFSGSTFSEKVAKDFDSVVKDLDSVIGTFSGDVFADDDSPLAVTLLALFDFTGDDFAGLTIDGAIFVGDFFAVFDGESFWLLVFVLPKNKREENCIFMTQHSKVNQSFIIHNLHK